MQAIGEVLNGRTDANPVDFRDPDYIERCLSWLPPTADLLAEVAALEATRDATEADSQAWRNADRNLRNTAWKIERCQQRDLLAADRPPGCWCLGIGGKNPRYTRGHVLVFSDRCDCPEGVRARETQTRLVAEERAAESAARELRLFGQARIPARFTDCTLETYPATPQSKPALDAVKLWLNGPGEGAVGEEAFWQARKWSLLLHGPFGVGKTGLAIAILRLEMMADGGLFFTVPTLLDCIRRTYGPNPIANEHEIVESVKTTPFLVLDDLGAERVTEWVREKLFTIINHRHDENLPTVFTSNLDVAQLGEHIGERTTWRIVEMCQTIHVDGPNLRV
jgi:DNA replication protein DnaC